MAAGDERSRPGDGEPHEVVPLLADKYRSRPIVVSVEAEVRRDVEPPVRGVNAQSMNVKGPRIDRNWLRVRYASSPTASAEKAHGQGRYQEKGQGASDEASGERRPPGACPAPGSVQT